MRLVLAASTSWTVMPATPVEAMAPVEEGAGPSGRPDVPSDPRLRIEISETVDDTDLLYKWIVGRSLGAVMANVPLVEGNERWVAVEIGGTTYDYRVSAVAMRDGEPVGSMSEPVACVCNSDELLSLVDDRIAVAAQELRVDTTISEPVPPSLSEPTPQVVPSSQGLAPPESRGSEPEDREPRLGALAYSGIGVGVLGAGTLGAGIALILRPDEWQYSGRIPVQITTHPPGIAMAAGGGAALVAGTVMLAVGLARRRDPSTSFSPIAGPRHVGMSITRRF